jgi:hypothetical protein
MTIKENRAMTIKEKLCHDDLKKGTAATMIKTSWAVTIKKPNTDSIRRLRDH